jgi:hypothetical protein
MKFITVESQAGDLDFHFTLETVDWMLKMMKDHFLALFEDFVKNKGVGSKGRKPMKRFNTFIYIHVMSLLFPGKSFHLIKNLGAYKYVNRPDFIQKSMEFFESE